MRLINTVLIAICIVLVIIIGVLLMIDRPVYDSKLQKNPYWPFTVEMSVKDR